MARRGRGAGSIETLKSGLYRAVISLGKDPLTGERLRERYTAETKRECQEWLHRRLAGGHQPASKLTLSAYLDQWLADKQLACEPRTHRYYGSHVRTHIAPHLGEIRLCHLQAGHLRDWHRKLSAALVAPGQQRKVAQTLRIALKDAVGQRLLGASCAALVPLPKAAEPQVTAMSAVEASSFLTAGVGSYLAAYWDLALDSGARPGEMLGLHWPEVDARRGEVAIERELEEIDGVFRLKCPKTRAGRRRVLLAPRTLASLQLHRERMAALGRDVKAGPVFVGRKTGKWIRQRVLSGRYFDPLIEKAGLTGRGFTPYSLRHTCATLLLAAGVSVRIVSERLGHEDVATTLRNYAHCLPGMQSIATAALENLFGDCPTAAPRPAGSLSSSVQGKSNGTTT